MAKGKYKSDMTLNEKVVVGIVRAADIYRKNFSALFKNFGLSFSQYGVLRVLEASENDQNTITNISRIMSVTSSNVTRMVQRLERDGFVIRKVDIDDDRVKIVEITPKGKKSLKNITVEQDKYLEKVLQDFSEELKTQIVSRLRTILRAES